MTLWCVSRLGFKLMLDSVLLGEIEEHGELEESLREFDTQWYIGMDGDPEWKAAVLDNKPNLFSLGHNNLQVSRRETHRVQLAQRVQCRDLRSKRDEI